MSLINDALKRASQSDRNRPRPTETHAAMEPVSYRRGKAMPVALVAGVVVALGLAGWFFWQWWHASHPPAPAKVAPAVVVAPKPAPKPVVVVAPVAPVVHETVPAPAVTSPPPVVVVAPPPAAVAVPAPAPPPAKPVAEKWPAELKVKGIFYNAANPRALINGNTVGVGEQIEGISITKIEQDRVTIEWHGQVKELMME